MRVSYRSTGSRLRLNFRRSKPSTRGSSDAWMNAPLSNFVSFSAIDMGGDA
jgi:hypothetical protein